jgi:AcrR family transcriptional regulator
MATRRYEQRVRAQSADETRRRILDAVEERLREAPTQALSIDRVARMAGVARSTVYLVFGSRAGLFDAFAADVMERGGFERVVEAVGHPDAREHLRGGIRGGVDVFAAYRDVCRALYSMAVLDEEAVGGAIRRQEDEAARVLWLLTSFDAFDLLYAGRGMSAGDVAETFITTAERTLLRSAAGGRPPPT